MAETSKSNLDDASPLEQKARRKMMNGVKADEAPIQGEDPESAPVQEDTEEEQQSEQDSLGYRD